MQELLEFQVSANAEGHRVDVRGEVDMSSAGGLAEVLTQFVNGSVTVDISGVSFLDSSGLNALVAAHKHIERRNGSLTIVGATWNVQRIFEVSGFDRILNVVRDDRAMPASQSSRSR